MSDKSKWDANRHADWVFLDASGRNSHPTGILQRPTGPSDLGLAKSVSPAGIIRTPNTAILAVRVEGVGIWGLLMFA